MHSAYYKIFLKQEEDDSVFQDGLVKVNKKATQWFAAIFQTKNEDAFNAMKIALNDFKFSDLSGEDRQSKALQRRSTPRGYERIDSVKSYLSHYHSTLAHHILRQNSLFEQVVLVVLRGFLEIETNAMTIFAPEKGVKVKEYMLYFSWPHLIDRLEIDGTTSFANRGGCAGLMINLKSLMNQEGQKVRAHPCRCIVS